MKWGLIISIPLFAWLMTRSYLYCMGGFAWGIPFSYINPHPGEHWLSIPFRQDRIDLGAILANYMVSFLLAHGIARLSQNVLLKFRSLKPYR